MLKALLISGGAIALAAGTASAQIVGGAVGGEPPTAGIGGSVSGSLEAQTDAVGRTGDAVDAAKAKTKTRVKDARDRAEAGAAATVDTAKAAAPSVEAEGDVSASGSAEVEPSGASAEADASARGSAGVQ